MCQSKGTLEFPAICFQTVVSILFNQSIQTRADLLIEIGGSDGSIKTLEKAHPSLKLFKWSWSWMDHN